MVVGRFETDVFPKIGKLPIASIHGPTLRAMLKPIEERGAVEFAHRIRAHCGNIFRFAIADGKASIDPSVGIAEAQPKPGPVVPPRSSAAKLVERLGGWPEVGGNEIDFLDDYVVVIHRLVVDIDNAARCPCRPE